MSRPKALIALFIYIAAIALANVATQFWGIVPAGFGLTVTAGTYFAGFALLARDFVHRWAGIWWVFAGIAAGAILSWVLTSGSLALASAVAFLAAELIDLTVFSASQRWGFTRAALLSNVISAPIDTVVFLWIAGFSLTWPLVAGQLVGKILWATVIPLALYVVGRRAVLRKSVDTAGA